MKLERQIAKVVRKHKKKMKQFKKKLLKRLGWPTSFSIRLFADYKYMVFLETHSEHISDRLAHVLYKLGYTTSWSA